MKADQAALDEFFDLKFYLPLPDYACRRVNPFAHLHLALGSVEIHQNIRRGPIKASLSAIGSFHISGYL